MFLRESFAIALFSFTVLCREIPVSELPSLLVKDYYYGNKHYPIQEDRIKFWKQERDAGLMDASNYPELGYTACIDGRAEAIPGDPHNTFRCSNTDLHHFLPHHDLGSFMGQGSSSWGWTSDDGREFVAVGQSDGTAFAEITKEGRMVYLGRLPTSAGLHIWKSIRSYKNYMLIGSEAEAHGIQIFDMTKLLNIDPEFPKTFDPFLDLTGHFRDLPLGRTHSLSVVEERNYVVAIGAESRFSECGGGLIFVGLDNPAKPKFLGCANQDGFVLDAQCVVYRGPDHNHRLGQEVCYAFNENRLTIYDVTEKDNPMVLSSTTYEGANYTFTGAVTDVNNQTHLLLRDELTERRYQVKIKQDSKWVPEITRWPLYPFTYIWDITSLEAPKQEHIFKSKTRSVPNYMNVRENLAYQANHGAGLQIIDVSKVGMQWEDPDLPVPDVCEVGSFDIYPEDDSLDGNGGRDYVGAWSSYAHFKSGYIFINTIERGAFVVKMSSKTCPES